MSNEYYHKHAPGIHICVSTDYTGTCAKEVLGDLQVTGMKIAKIEK